MSAELLARGVVTDALVELLQHDTDLGDLGFLVGDGVVPDAAGWPEGKTGVGEYVPSITVSTGEAAPRDRDPVSSRHSSWVARYGLSSLGAARTQADNVADHARAACLKLRGEVLPAGMDGGHFKVTDVVFSRLAPLLPDKSTDPPTWGAADVVDLWLDRERT